MRERITARARAVVLVALAALLLAGCSSLGSTGDKGYIDGKGVITQLPRKDWKTTRPVQGTTLDGKKVALSDYRGKVVVVNVWGSWCPPCIQETPDLKKAYTRLRAARPGVAFVGVDIKESAASAQSFVVKNRIPYPSLAYEGGKSLLALHGTAPATPTTLVLDQQGRIAARVLGPVDATTLVGLVQDVIPSTPAAGTR